VPRCSAHPITRLQVWHHQLGRNKKVHTIPTARLMFTLEDGRTVVKDVSWGGVDTSIKHVMRANELDAWQHRSRPSHYPLHHVECFDDGHGQRQATSTGLARSHRAPSLGLSFQRYPSLLLSLHALYNLSASMLAFCVGWQGDGMRRLATMADQAPAALGKSAKIGALVRCLIALLVH
jgi:hypothetical protein